ncbi:hypothetical protein [Pseudomonas taetrolens]|uniref:hypothetical protein n=1 Tax=Pseudomonas taetrolens TaxID=47884 RepID=UPI003F965587
MGQARNKGSFEQRKKEALKRDKRKLVEIMGSPSDPESEQNLRAGIAPFLALMSPEKWQRRRASIIESLNSIGMPEKLAESKPIRVRADEIGWYLFLCEQALDDPLCMDVSQIARTAPFFAGIGSKWHAADRVVGLDKKIREILHKYKKNPDGLLFEILVALSYAEKGWDVELLDEKPPLKSPDMVVRMDGIEIFIECKRLERRTSYAEKERTDFLHIWDSARDVLWKKQQWVWFKGVFHVEISSLPKDFLAKIFDETLPLGNSESLIYDGVEAKIYARLIDKVTVKKHLLDNRVKMNSAALSTLIGGDWAPVNSAVTMAQLIKPSYVNGCEAPTLGTYVEEIDWACGFTRDFDSEISLNKKAKDITSLLTDAISQIPEDKPSIIHIAAETLEGTEVERIRSEKVIESMSKLDPGKPLLSVRFHRLQANQNVDKLWEMDETVQKFQPDGLPDAWFVECAVLPITAETRDGAHWDLYPPK